ncbi:acyltransferase [Crassaminicella thermophila]|uniref:Acyltransferase n=1 Tax=Crassaminicella thermophila TaxID=2599308 RepID=A0A5C0SBZ3_CRATE|nr:acyltransferase [Crassaminicella thermophila]QEK11447.1 acyltransferase [Crassaminicella thermophila]
MKKILFLMLYYFVGRHLPSSQSPYSFGAKKLRYFLCKGLFKETGKNVNIEHGAFFGKGSDITIGDNSGLGIDCRVSGPLKIGKNVMMGPEVMIYTSNHRIDDLDKPIIMQGETPKELVEIEDDVWIGARAIILPGIKIGKGAVVAAGAIVTKDVPKFAVVGGNPAKIIKFRK